MVVVFDFAQCAFYNPSLCHSQAQACLKKYSAQNANSEYDKVFFLKLEKVSLVNLFFFKYYQYTFHNFDDIVEYSIAFDTEFKILSGILEQSIQIQVFNIFSNTLVLLFEQHFSILNRSICISG